MTDQPTMRERLIEAARKASATGIEMLDPDYGAIVDAILTELEIPDATIIQAGENVELGGMSGFTAAIQAIRSGG